MTSTVVKITNIPLGIDEMEFAHLLVDAMEAQQSSIKDTFLSCQILHRDSVAVLEFEPTANSHLQWNNLENINIDGKNLQVMSVLNPLQHNEVIPNGFTSNGSVSNTAEEEEKMDVDEGVESGESSPMVPEGSEEFLKISGVSNFALSGENIAKENEGQVESHTDDPPTLLSPQPAVTPIVNPPSMLPTKPVIIPNSRPPVVLPPLAPISQVASKPAPASVSKPAANKQTIQKTSRVVFFDIETTGLDQTTCEIVQVAAMSGPKYFSAYIKPVKGIPPDATKINGLEVVGDTLLKNGKSVETQAPEVAWKGFIEFIRSLENVILMGHYAHKFDFPLLVRDIQEHGFLQDLISIVSGCVDTIDVFRGKLPDRVRRRLSFKQVDLAKEYKVNISQAHDALGDVRMLSQLCQKIGLTSHDIAKHRKMIKTYC